MYRLHRWKMPPSLLFVGRYFDAHISFFPPLLSLLTSDTFSSFICLLFMPFLSFLSPLSFFLYSIFFSSSFFSSSHSLFPNPCTCECRPMRGWLNKQQGGWVGVYGTSVWVGGFGWEGVLPRRRPSRTFPAAGVGLPAGGGVK